MFKYFVVWATQKRETCRSKYVTFKLQIVSDFDFLWFFKFINIIFYLTAGSVVPMNQVHFPHHQQQQKCSDSLRCNGSVCYHTNNITCKYNNVHSQSGCADSAFATTRQAWQVGNCSKKKGNLDSLRKKITKFSAGKKCSDQPEPPNPRSRPLFSPTFPSQVTTRPS
jgi:hypothetical protein